MPMIRARYAAFPAPPSDLADDRFGIRSWHHAELMEELTALSAENRLLQIIDQVYFTGAPASFDSSLTSRGVKAMELEQALRKSDFSFACEKLLSYSGACGSHL